MELNGFILFFISNLFRYNSYSCLITSTGLSLAAFIEI